MAFKWNINPSGTNIYVDKDGNDSTGNGTSSNPYKSIAKATSVGTSGNNIILGNGVWSEQRTLNSRGFKWWGNGRTIINCTIITTLSLYSTDNLYFIEYIGSNNAIERITLNQRVFLAQFCRLQNLLGIQNEGFHTLKNSILVNCQATSTSYFNLDMRNCILINSNIDGITTSVNGGVVKIINNIIIGLQAINTSGIDNSCDYNNFTTLSIPTTNGANSHSINNASTGQTVADYFNNYNATYPWLSDFTAKLGSKNIRAGYGNGDIGFSQGFGRSASDAEFSTAGGATLKGLSLVSNQIVLSQVNLYPISATASSIVLDASASAVNDHYKDLFIRITSGTGVGQIKQITAYNGTTKEATISGTWATIPDSSSTYTISGYLESADIDLGKIVKVKRNWFYGQFGYDLTTVTGRYNQKASASGTDVATSPTFANFGMKYSKENDLNSKPWLSFSPNGKTLFDGTYGDGDDGYTIANGTYILARFIRIKFNVEV